MGLPAPPTRPVTSPWSAPDPVTRAPEGSVGERHRYDTPTGECCVRTLRVDGTVEGRGDCMACGTCLLLAQYAWGGP